MSHDVRTVTVCDTLVNVVTPEQAAKRAQALARVRAARVQRDKAYERLVQEILAALDVGAAQADIAVAAGLSRQRISQISRGE